MIMKRLLITLATIALASSAANAIADTILWVSDTAGNVGQVDITTQTVGAVHNTGESLTDIGFTSGGTLYGTTFTDLYSITDTSII